MALTSRRLKKVVLAVLCGWLVWPVTSHGQAAPPLSQPPLQHQPDLPPRWRPPTFALLDLAGDGLALSDLSDPVRMRFAGQSETWLLSWTAAGHEEAFLWLDQDGDGQLRVPEELLQSNVASSAGAGSLFAELRRVELSEGNGNEVLDSDDAVFHRLALWTDRDHNARASENEISHLEDHSIVSIPLREESLGLLDGSLNFLESEVQVSLPSTTTSTRTTFLVATRFASIEASQTNPNE